MSLEKERKQQAKAIKKANVGQIYIKNKDGNVEFKNFDEMLINGKITLKQHLHDVEERHSFLVAQYQALHDSLKGALFISPNKRYIVVGLNNGYICKGTDYVVELTVRESELYKGYCKIENFATVIDNEMKIKYMSTFEGGKL